MTLARFPLKSGVHEGALPPCSELSLGGHPRKFHFHLVRLDIGREIVGARRFISDRSLVANGLVVGRHGRCCEQRFRPRAHRLDQGVQIVERRQLFERCAG